ncbi:PepSY domain-containing protein [Pontibacter sp. JAM-7]|uniref:PepSY domain-containing protein n=1 Tax=Pontibacter sp. JAM-7 TaxID=3366581 RepID=UPI003AF779FF
MPLTKPMLRRRFTALFSGALVALFSAGAQSVLAAEPMSLQQARQMVEAQTGGQVVKSQTGYSQGTLVYRFRIVQQGRIRDLLMDAQTGTLINPLKGDKNNENSSGRR